EWRQKNPQHPLFLAYFGSAYPRYYGLDYTPMPGGAYMFDDEESARFPSPGERAVIAISATHLQGIYQTEAMRTTSAPLWEHRYDADAELGGSIYVFQWPLG